LKKADWEEIQDAVEQADRELARCEKYFLWLAVVIVALLVKVVIC